MFKTGDIVVVKATHTNMEGYVGRVTYSKYIVYPYEIGLSLFREDELDFPLVEVVA